MFTWKGRVMKMKLKKFIVIALAAALVLTGCSSKTTSKSSTTSDSKTTESTDSGETTEDETEMFTDRDKEIGYDEENSVKITLADDKSTSDSDSVQVEDNTVTITEEGTYILSGSLSDGMVIVDVDEKEKVQLVLNGVDITSKESAAIYVRSADKVFITTAADSENQLTNGGTYTAIDDNNIDAVIFSKDDLTLNGAGTLTINAQEGHGIVSKDDLVVTCGTYDITAKKHGLAGKDSVRIAEGIFRITCGKDGIHGANSDDTTLGFVYIAGGTFEIAAEDDGIHTDSALTIEDGTIHITESCEGLEGAAIDINGGEIEVTSTDDGINATSGNSSDSSSGGNDMFTAQEGVYVKISGGKLYVNASGDGIDSNGDLYVTGGETYVSGPTSGGDGALDYNGSAEITGGIFLAAGSLNMAQNFGDTSTQGVMLVNTGSQEAGSTIALTDSDGKELMNWTSDKTYECVVISCPDITKGNTYTVTAGSFSQEITMENTIYGESSMEGGGMGGPSGNAPFDGEPSGEVPSGEKPSGEKPSGEMGDRPNDENGKPSGESSDANGDRPTPPDAK